MEDDRCDGLTFSEDLTPHTRSKPKDRSRFTLLGPSRLVPRGFLTSLSLAGKKPRSTSDPKSLSGRHHDEMMAGCSGGGRRVRTVTEPSSLSYSPSSEVFFNGGSHPPRSPTVSLETSFLGNRVVAMAGQPGAGGGSSSGDGGGSSSSVCEIEVSLPKSTGAGPGPGAEAAAVAGGSRDLSVGGVQQRERLALGDGPSCLASGGPTFKSRSQSFNTDTTTSGISSMSSSPSRETAAGTGTAATTPTPTTPGATVTSATDSSSTISPSSATSTATAANDVDCASLDTEASSAKTVKTVGSLTPPPQPNHLPLSKASSVSLVPPGSAHTLPRRAQSLKSPSVAAVKGLVDYGYIYTSPRDALGYATLKRLQQQRIHPSLSHSEALASPAKDVLFTDAITMKTGSLDSRLTSRR